MSRASKHLDWCLNKAKREIEECKNQGKRIKHRGLLKINPDLERAKEHIEKAEHELEVTEYLKKGKFLDAGVSTVFYSMYHCFLAVAAKFGYESSNQTCTISLMRFLKVNYKDKIFVFLFPLFFSSSLVLSDASHTDNWVLPMCNPFSGCS